MEVSTANFIARLLSSFLVATFGLCFLIFTPRNCLQKYMCVFQCRLSPSRGFNKFF